jgi:Helix-turn-helix domain
MISLRIDLVRRILRMHSASFDAPELMTEITTLGSYLRREREHRGLSLRTISEKTKVSLGLLEGLEADDISRWPGGIFRRAFVRSYAQCVGLNPEDVIRRFEEQFQPPEPVAPQVNGHGTRMADTAASNGRHVQVATHQPPSRKSRLLGTAADVTVALVLAFSSAAAGSRLLWPVMLIAAYYAIGIMLTGTSPMVALLTDQPVRDITPKPIPAPLDIEPRPIVERRRHPRRSVTIRQPADAEAQAQF